MPANLTLDSLKAAFDAGEIDTVLVVFPDMQGRLLGKRFHTAFFLDGGHEETHCCNYLLATDIEMMTVPGYRSTGWEKGYGDYVMKPDLSTLRRVPWLEGTAMVLCDLFDHHTGEPVTHSPRAILRRQIERARAMGYEPMMATELEFFMFENSYESLRDNGFAGLRPFSAYNEDYHIFQTTKEEGVMRKIRNDLYAAGIPVENTKGEAETGQGEVNYRYSDALNTADNHTVIKQAIKEIAWQQGKSVTFMSKIHHDKVGSSSHVHQSLWTMDGKPAFFDPAAEHGMSALMRHFVAGQLAHAADCTYFMAPYVNSYKRFVPGTFAPTKTVWSVDNRTAGFRVCGDHSKGIRIECRIPGSEINPYLTCAALLAAGLDGIENRLELGPEVAGDTYSAKGAPEIPHNLRDAAARLHGSAMLRRALGDEVVEHYHHAARWEVLEHDRVVTDFEVQRLFERC